MTFYPLEYVGRRPFGWQGIIPAKAHKMATKAVKLVTSKLISVEEQFEKLKADDIVDEMWPQLKVSLSRSIINESMRKEMPLVWRFRSGFAERSTVMQSAEAQFPTVAMPCTGRYQKRIYTSCLILTA